MPLCEHWESDLDPLVNSVSRLSHMHSYTYAYIDTHNINKCTENVRCQCPILFGLTYPPKKSHCGSQLSGT